ncbi:Zn-dependent alcohol dehydrogenase [Paeniglutamicibacter sp.]|uniref:Zn-dependent alcohol dehydrogenase n=1 Tax=Paeniglutamicibacter sp. TaxID=1934391 RepID=UPI003988FE04
MRAAIMHETGSPLVIEEVEIDDPMPGEVLVKVLASGLCHSDLHVIQGKLTNPLPVILGHEAAGVVEAVGAGVTYVSPGDRVVTFPLPFCGECDECMLGRPNLCSAKPNRTPEDAPRVRSRGQAVGTYSFVGGFAEKMLVHERSVVRIPDEVPIEVAALLGCGVVTGVGAVANTAKVKPGETVAVIGCGGVGLNVIQGARLAGAGRIIAIDRVASKLDHARKMGATDVIDASLVDPVAAVQELCGGVDHALEVVGLAQTFEQGLAMLGAGGTLTLVGAPPETATGSVHLLSLLWERRVQGSLMGSARSRVDIPRLAQHYLAGNLELDSLVSRRIKLEEINEGFEDMLSGEVARTVIVFD